MPVMSRATFCLGGVVTGRVVVVGCLLIAVLRAPQDGAIQLGWHFSVRAALILGGLVSGFFYCAEEGCFGVEAAPCVPEAGHTVEHIESAAF